MCCFGIFGDYFCFKKKWGIREFAIKFFYENGIKCSIGFRNVKYLLLASSAKTRVSKKSRADVVEDDAIGTSTIDGNV